MKDYVIEKEACKLRRDLSKHTRVPIHATYNQLKKIEERTKQSKFIQAHDIYFNKVGNSLYTKYKLDKYLSLEEFNLLNLLEQKNMIIKCKHISIKKLDKSIVKIRKEISIR